MDLRPAIDAFASLLETRIDRGVFTTEDSIRYTFFAALLSQTSLRPEDIVLEQPHPNIPRAEIDTWISAANGANGAAVEFKYDRQIPSAHNGPRTQKAGKVFHDFYRLGRLSPDMRRYFVYVADVEMTSYFSNPSNNLAGFFNLAEGRSLLIDSAFLSGRPATFVNSLGPVPNVEAISVCSRSLPNSHELRVFEVRNAAASEG